ncbi:hypothetical protein QK3_3863 [Clostridioides difficile DA00145]|nr:hypothetical protein QK3_3579 [Clostridioides difficile DA00145]EQG62957.1 hypothetical protein QK3_3863 [Clostridioides difficile DA00145]
MKYSSHDGLIIYFSPLCLCTSIIYLLDFNLNKYLFLYYIHMLIECPIKKEHFYHLNFKYPSYALFNLLNLLYHLNKILIALSNIN